jgi:hypothetical protein
MTGKSKKRSGSKKAKDLAAQYQPNINVAAERKKARLVSIVFCLYHSVDKEGRNNLLGCFDRIFADPATKLTGQFILVIRTAETRKGGLVASILDPTNKAVAAFVFDTPDISVSPDKHMHLQFFGPVNFPANTEGIYWIDVSYQGKSLGGDSLTVEFQKKEASQG